MFRFTDILLWSVGAMPELPEIAVIAKQMNTEIAGKQIVETQVEQPKILNMPIAEFAEAAKGKTVDNVSSRGKWLFMKLDPAYFMLINLGMGGDLIYFAPDDELPEKYQFKLRFSDKSGFTIRFSWFGFVHLLPEKDLADHKMTARLGPSPLDRVFTVEHFKELLAGRRARIKNFLLDQKNLAGIGNVYIQDILFKARLHPNRVIPTLSVKEIEDLYDAIQKVLNRSIELGGLSYEKDFYGEKGRYTMDEFLVGYKTGKPCPECDSKIVKIKTGSTSSYICPTCQSLE